MECENEGNKKFLENMIFYDIVIFYEIKVEIYNLRCV